MKLLFSALVCCSFVSCVAGAAAAPSWNDFRVTWPKFTTLPQSQADAQAQGWAQDTGKACTAGSVQGLRFYLPTDDNPLSMFLIFNTLGHLSGVQTASQATPPAATLAPSGPWSKDMVGNTTLFTLTMYFRDPTLICSGSDSGSKLGDGLLFLSDGTNVTAIPTAEKDLPLGAGTWGKGKCFYTMGNHYWFNINADSDCDTLMPLFLLYNGGQVNGFGFALAWGASQPGGRWEHPTSSVLPMFFSPDQIATCFNDKGRIFSTMHFYFSNPILDFC